MESTNTAALIALIAVFFALGVAAIGVLAGRKGRRKNALGGDGGGGNPDVSAYATSKATKDTDARGSSDGGGDGGGD
jgi:hypothetical protein